MKTQKKMDKTERKEKKRVRLKKADQVNGPKGTEAQRNRKKGWARARPKRNTKDMIMVQKPQKITDKGEGGGGRGKHSSQQCKEKQPKEKWVPETTQQSGKEKKTTRRPNAPQKKGQNKKN